MDPESGEYQNLHFISWLILPQSFLSPGLIYRTPWSIYKSSDQHFLTFPPHWFHARHVGRPPHSELCCTNGKTLKFNSSGIHGILWRYNLICLYVHLKLMVEYLGSFLAHRDKWGQEKKCAVAPIPKPLYCVQWPAWKETVWRIES